MIRRKRVARRNAQEAVGRVRYVEQALWSGAQALTPSQHSGLRWRRPVDLRFAENLDAVPFALPEALAAAGHLPLALSAGSVPRPMILLRASPQTSGLIRNGRLAGRYMPEILRVYPFCPALDQTDHNLVLAADLEGEYLGPEPGGQPLFDAAGQMNPALAAIVQRIAQWQAGREAASIAAKALARADLLCPAHATMPDWRSVDPQKLSDLDADTALALHKVGALALAHALIVGAGHIARLSEHPQRAQAETPEAMAGQDFIAAMGRAQTEGSDILFHAFAPASPADQESATG